MNSRVQGCSGRNVRYESSGFSQLMLAGILDRIAVAQAIEPSVLIRLVKCRTVIDGGAQDRQVEADVDPCIKMKRFERAKTLVVIEGDIVRETLAHGRDEGDVGNDGANECWMLDAGCWMLDAGCWMLNVEC